MGTVSQREVTLAQLVNSSVGQADVQRFEPHLGHNCKTQLKSEIAWLGAAKNNSGLQLGYNWKKNKNKKYKNTWDIFYLQ